MVRFHSEDVQASATNLNRKNGPQPVNEEEQMSATANLKPEALSPDGEILVFAPPIVLGFLGAPLALADSLPKPRAKSRAGKNWAKRRAYGA